MTMSPVMVAIPGSIDLARIDGKVSAAAVIDPHALLIESPTRSLHAGGLAALVLHGDAPARISSAVVTMAIFRGARECVLCERRNGGEERNERHNKRDGYFASELRAVRRIVGRRFGSNRRVYRIHAVESTTARADSDGTMNLRFVTKERTGSRGSRHQRLALLTSRDAARISANQEFLEPQLQSKLELPWIE